MSKIAKSITMTIAVFCSLCLLVLVLAVAFVVLVDPNDYKPQINQAIARTTQTHMDIQGDLSWQFFPWVGIQAKHVHIQNPQGFEFKKSELAQIDQLSFELDPVALLRGRFKFNTLRLKAFKVYLEKNAKGHTNWQRWLNQNALMPTPATIEKTAYAGPESPLTPEALNWSISQIELEGGEIHYLDRTQHIQRVIRDFNLTSAHMDQSLRFPIESSFSYRQIDLATSQKPIAMQVQLTTRVGMNQHPGERLRLDDLDIRFDIHTVHNRQVDYPGSLFTQVIVNDENRFTLNPLQFDLNGDKATGQLSVHPSQGLHFQLQFPKLNVDRLKNTILSVNPSIPAPPMPNSRLSSSMRIQKVSHHPTFPVKGILDIEALTIQGLQFTQVKVPIENPKGIWTFDPIEADLYQGHLKSRCLANLTGPLPWYKITGSLYQVESAPLLKDALGQSKLSGLTNATFDYEAQGKDKATRLATLKGIGYLQIKNGTFYGLDLEYYFEKARALSQRVASPEKKHDRKTEFTELNGSFKAHKGLLENPDLKVTSKEFTLDGEGNFDLLKSYLRYQLKAQKVYADPQAHPNALPVALRISGPLDELKVVPDFEAYLQPVLEKQLKSTLGDLLNEENSDPNTPSKPIEKQLEEKLEKEIKKGLEKLFKF